MENDDFTPEQLAEIERRLADIGDRSKWIDLDDYLASLTAEEREQIEAARVELKRKWN